MMSFVKKNKYILVAAAILLVGSYGGYKYYQSTQVTTTAVKITPPYFLARFHNICK